ncbi:MAG: hypothetical protein JJT85_01665 [Chromatiales bacterium]|nr:hypothetical protein [Chromatiales bacterium]
MALYYPRMNVEMLKRSVCLAGLLALLTGTPVLGLELDPDRVAWSAVQMQGSRLFLSVDAEVRLSLRPAVVVKPKLLVVDDSRGLPVAPGPQIQQTTYRTRAVGQRSQIMLFSDPRTGAALQRSQHDYEGRLRERVYRYTDEGAWLETAHPATSAEESLPPGQWTDRERGFRQFPHELGNAIIAEPTGIFYIIAATGLERPGQTLDFVVYSRRNLHQVNVRVTEPVRIASDYRRLGPGGSERRRGNQQAIRVLIHGESLGEDDEDDEFELLGLRGQLELLLEPESRAPLQLSGNIRLLGRVSLRSRMVEVR